MAQATLLFGVVRARCGPLGSTAAQWATLSALAVAGTAAGLLLSALARTEGVATALVPMAVLPQIVLAGVIAPLSGLADLLSRALVTVHWGQQGLGRLLPEADRIGLGRARGDWTGPAAIVLAHAAVASIAAVVVLWRTRGRAGR